MLKQYEKIILNYDLLNKYHYKNINEIPKITCIECYFNIKKYDLKKILTCLLALEILSLNKCKMLKIKSSILSLKIRKGHPIGCSITIRKKKKKQFILLLLNEIKKLNYSSTLLPKGFVVTSAISNFLILPEFEKNYNIFKNLNNLIISIYTTSKSYKELNFLLQCYKLT